MNYSLTVPQIKEAVRDKLSHTFGVSLQNATNEEYYKAVALIVREQMADLLSLHGVPAGPLSEKQPV